MKEEKIKGYLNISRKAGYLIIGGEKLEDYNKKLYLVLYDTQAANNTLKVVRKIEEKGINAIAVDKLDELSSINNCKIIGIKNKDISEIVEKLIND